MVNLLVLHEFFPTKMTEVKKAHFSHADVTDNFSPQTPTFSTLHAHLPHMPMFIHHDQQH
jgi:hypothetical protein